MQKATKNTHLNHLEDNIFLGHIDGTREAIKFIREFRDVLKGFKPTDIKSLSLAGIILLLDSNIFFIYLTNSK